jgi:hypothetical protein
MAYLSGSRSGSDEVREVEVLETVLSVVSPDSWSSDGDVESSLGSAGNSSGGIGGESGVSEGVLVGDAQWVGGETSSSWELVFDDESVVSADQVPNKIAFAHFVCFV